MTATAAPDVDPDTFRKETRAWLEANTPPGWKERLSRADEDEALAFFQSWARTLHSGGLLVANWPERFGGRDASFAMQVIIQQEMTRADAPRPRYLSISIGHAAATLIVHGTPEQQELLAGILEGDVWCQGFSEPNAGSDLAALRTRADRHGDHYVVNGQKVWSSMGIHARWCLLLARTDPDVPKHKGISCFILDMRSEGVEVRPIRQATGASEFAEVFLNDVHIPASMLVGAENDGWRIAQTTLVTERYAQMIELEEGLRALLAQALDEAAEHRIPDGTTLADDNAFRQEFGALASQVEVLGLINDRVIGSIASGEEPGPEGSILKLYFSELLQRLTRFGIRSKGLAAHIDPLRKTDVSYFSGDWMLDHIRSWTWTIAAGSNEIQRNIIGERVLGLPREPRG
jgi:alkylation response protein AidB-like acyl-CoA dehydrogenase